MGIGTQLCKRGSGTVRSHKLHLEKRIGKKLGYFMIFKKDNFIFGLALGFIAPMIGFLVYKLIKFKGLSFSEMLQWMKFNPNLITVSISISLMANAILFTIYVNGYRDKTAKGIFVMTMIYAVIAFAFKYW